MVIEGGLSSLPQEKAVIDMLDDMGHCAADGKSGRGLPHSRTLRVE